MAMLASSEIFLFEDFRLDRRAGGLFRRDHEAEAPVELGSRALDILGVLVARAGEVISKDEIATVVWELSPNFGDGVKDQAAAWA
jgi:DNA-binding winged helix-turn-helix (wHTH) protein